MLRDVAWRTMTAYDLPAVQGIADTVHVDFFEAPEVLAERLSLYHNGCYLLEVGEKPAGYVLSHPWTYGTLPPLNTLLKHLPAEPDTYYLHDLCLLPVARRVGAASRIVEALTKHARAEGYPTMTLVAVAGSIPFWQRQGFETVEIEALYAKLLSYEDAASYMVKRLG
ncbi:GNAT family N-acetyltransferase [Devosia sp. ZB163]|uniref:GNAT family N-acetyltransferase n=1 Tax=Devosia sp. ZB163 TaxID=3025938 RepID=UPI00235F3121|nr:GNAT family N-acetyltransferase [Devosia sp. ZB163]MDC9822899.1 GNAT family N-acetyltransferase [Devosia sp. ZB163]